VDKNTLSATTGQFTKTKHFVDFDRFQSFLFGLTYRRLTLECYHSAGIPTSGSLFWCDFGNLRHLRCETIQNFLPMIPESYENEHSILLIFAFFKVFLF